MKSVFGIIMLGATLLLSGCATGMSDEACLAADWRTVGFEDGVAGKQASAIGYYRNQCADAGVTPDLDAYLDGRQQGLETYCEPANGYRVGERGGAYHGVCDASIEPDFLIAYEDGRELFSLRRDVRRLENQLEDAEETLVSMDIEIQQLTLKVISDGLTPDQRLAILADQAAVSERKKIVEADIIALREALAASRDRLNLYAAR